MIADDVVAVAKSCLKTPFVHQGRIKGKALDCAGLAVTVARELGVEYTDFQGYGREPFNGELERVMDAQPGLVRVTDKADVRAGDILLMRFAREPQHVAICAGLILIHSYEAVGMCCEHVLTDEWRRRIVRVYRFKDLA